MTDKVKLYVVRNDDGEYLMDPAFAAWFPDWTDDIITADLYEHKEEAEETANKCDSHVVELVEKPEPEVVSQKEASLIDELVENASDEFPAGNISNFIDNNWSDYGSHNRALDELRLISALVNGYTVAKEKRYQLKVPYADGWIFQKYSPESKLKHHNRSDTFPVRNTGLIGRQLELTWFTAAEIQQYGLQDCEMNMWREG
ncbi:DUF1642 domain-containing protein [Lacticaseibacillus mingshuiensis]|uniref:DUF1642 domain-containing protein n=1 Tax=Lacticaseibacillus mingshuiensis TaxID=2799574 RepID=UPI0019510694|nr:DUF1642 domain-containing protein [Lacticaseibacillus mingshuiensis]